MVRGKSANGRAEPRRKAELERLLVKFGSVRIGKEKCAIRCVIDRVNCDIDTLEPMLCNARLKVVLVHDPADEKDGEGQLKLINTTMVKIVSVVDVHSLAISAESVGCTMQFSRKGMDLGELANLAERTGRLTADRIGEASAAEDAEPVAAEAAVGG